MENNESERQRRSTINSHFFNRNTVSCYLLYNYEKSSRYCGVRHAARVMYTKMKCYYKPSNDNNDNDYDIIDVDVNPPDDEDVNPKDADDDQTTQAPVPVLPKCGVSDLATEAETVQKTSNVFLQPRIVGGKVTGQCSVYPWMVRLTVDGGEVCGGTILDATHILTAAHCAYNKNSITAVIGKYDTSKREGTEQSFDVDMKNGVAIHEDFSFTDKTNDIAVLTLDKPIDLNRDCATPICVDEDYKVTSGETCTVAGWGVLNENSRTASEKLNSVNITVVQGEDCNLVFPGAAGDHLTDPSKQLCAGQPNVGGVDACAGDSGGPLFCLDQTKSRWVVVGVVSYGNGCAQPDSPGVYASVEDYYDWIQDKL